MLIKENNPWVGLASYKRQDAARFFGREKETRKLSELIQANYCTILYGQSGAGKTSLIQAGVCPMLSDMQFLPIPIKLDHSGTVSYAQQIMDRVREEIRGIDGEIEFPIEIPVGVDDRSQAWLFFHTANFWNGQNYRITPALFIDQFEELFNLTSDLLEVQAFFDLVDELLQMVPPERVSEYFERNNIRLPYREKPAFRLLLSLREDFLARLEDYSYSIPALRRNRVGLASMNGQQALDVIMNPMPGLVERDAALRILSKVTAQEVHDDPYYLEKLPVDSCILSLFCTEIYNRAAESGKDGITQDIIDQFGGNIIQTFYERNMEGISTASARYLESHLLTTNGFRNTVALEDLVPDHVKMDELRRLEENRIVRIETMNGTQRVEFTHDVLCKVATNHRKSRNQKSEHRRSIQQRILYWMESALHVGLVGCFVTDVELNQLSYLRSPKAALFILLFLIAFLFRLAHHGNRFKSVLVMAGVAVFGWIPLYLHTESSSDSTLFVILLFLYAFSATVYPFIELARQRRSQNSSFIRNSYLLTEDRPRWAAAIAFLVASFGMACLLAYRNVNGTFSACLLMILVPLLLEVFCFFYPERSDIRTRWTNGLIAEGGMLLLVASQYANTRTWFYFALGILATACFLFARKVKGGKPAVKILAGVATWIMLGLVMPPISLGFNPGLLGSLARVPHGTIGTDSRTFPNLIKVCDEKGRIGAVVRNDMVLPPQFDDIRTYAVAEEIDFYYTYDHDGYEARGSLHDLVFLVKEKGEDSFSKIRLSQFPAPPNRISRIMADECQLFLQHADSIFSHTVQTNSSGMTAKVMNISSDDFDRGWKPMIKYYDPQIQLFLANYYRNQPEKCKDHAFKFLIYTGANLVAQRFLMEGNWKDEKNNILNTILFTHFYNQTGVLPNNYREQFCSEVKNDTSFRNLLDSLLTSPADSAMQTILNSTELRKWVYFSIANNSEEQNKFSFLSLPVPEIKGHVFTMMEQDEAVNAAYYSIFLRDADKAEYYSRQAIAESKTESQVALATTNLITALFLKGDTEEPATLLSQHAFRRTSNGYLVIDGLYQDLKQFTRYGVLDQDQLKKYQHLLETYSPDNFRGRQFDMLDDDGNVFFYYKNANNPFSFISYDQVDLYIDGKPYGYLDSLLVPYLEDSPAAIMAHLGKKGYIDRETGRIILPTSADHAWFFSEGLAFIEKGNRIQVINTDGSPAFEKTFIDPRDYESPDFVGIDFIYHGGIAPMIDETGRMGLIDTHGNWVLNPEFDYITNPDDSGVRHIWKDGKLFIMDDVTKQNLRPAHPIVFDLDGILTLWDPSASRRVRYHQLDSRLGSIRSISGNSLSRLLLSFDDSDQSLLLQKESQSWFMANKWGMKVELNPDGSSFVTYRNDDWTAYFTDMAEKQTESRFNDEDKSGFHAFVFSKDGKKAASAHENGMLRIWDVASGLCIASYPTDCGIFALDFSPDGSVLVAADIAEGAIIYWPIEKTPVKLTAHSYGARDVKFSHRGDWFVSCSEDGSIVLWDKSGKRIKALETDNGGKFSLAVSPDDKQIATFDSYNYLSVYSVSSGAYEKGLGLQCSGPSAMVWCEE